MHVRRRILSCLALVLGLSVLSGCKVTGEDIDYWKRTVKGPGKIVAVILADRYPIELRTQAALALVEMERQDVDGVAQLQQTLQTLQGQDPEAVEQIVAGMVPGLLQMMQGADEQHDPNLGPPPRQTRAKDAAYLLIPHANASAREQLTDAVVGWYAVDFANRSLAGNYSSEQVVRSLGSPAARQLVEGLNAHMPQQALVKMAELVSQVGDEETKQMAGERLVAIEQEMETSEFIDWLKSEIRDAMEGEVSDDRVTNIAVVNREKFLNEGALPAMKHLAAVPEVRARLLAIASSPPPESMPDGAKEAINLRRQRALMALEGNVEEEHLDALLAIALDENNPINVRDYAFDRVGDIRSEAAIPRLWSLVQTTENEMLPKRLRWRAGELVLAIGGGDVVTEFLSKLPTEDGVEYEPEELEGYATRMSQMTPQPVQVVERQLSAPQWFKRVIALRFIERRGSADDVAKLQRLTRDRAETVGEGWERLELPTVGAVAESAVESLQERLASPGDGEAESADAGDDAGSEE
jgi:hypothetical protein